MRRHGTISLAVERLDDRCAPSSIHGVAGSIDAVPVDPATPAPAALVSTQPAASAASTNGAASQMPAFYEGTQVTVNMKQEPDGASAALIAHNGSINTIYAYADLDE